MLRSVVLGCGSYLPSRVLTNAELSRMVDTSDEWIVQRTGIRERHIAAEGEFTSDIGIKAARAALAACRHRRPVDRPDRARDLDARTTPFRPARSRCRPGSASPMAPPSTCRRSARASCSAWRPPTACCATGAFKRALVIGAETFSRILDWNDRSTCVLFGDGAGAVVLEAQQQAGTREDRGILTTHLCARTAATSPSSMSTAARPRPRPSGTCGWKAARCSSTRWR